MKKSIVYSFAALAGFPAVAMAEVVPVDTKAASAGLWAGTYATAEAGTYGIQAGATATQTVKLKPGNYVVDGTYSENPIVKAEGSVITKQEFKNKKLTFTVGSEGNVTISISEKDGKTFTMKNVQVDLLYDFDVAYGLLNSKLSTVKTTMEGYEGVLGELTARLDANNKAAGEIQKKINEIGSTQTYNTYTKYELYKGDDNNKVAVEIAALAKKAASDYAVDQMEAGVGGDPGLTDVTTNFKSIDDKDPNKAVLKPVLDALTAKVKAYETNQTGDEAAVADVQKQLNDLNDKIGATQTSYFSYKANLDKINAAQKEIDDAALAFNNNFTDKSFTDHVANPLPKGADIAYGKIYANLDAAAREELSVVAAKVKAARDANAAGHAKFDKGKYNAPADVDVKGEFKTGELIVKKSASDVQTEFLDKKTTLKKQYKIASDFTNRVNKTPAKGAEALVADKKAAAETAITNFVAQLDGDNNAELAILTKNYPAGYIADKNKKDAYSKAKDAVDEFEKAFGSADDYFTVVNNVTAAQDKISKMNLAQYDANNYTPSTSYTTYVDAISAALAPLANKAQQAYENGKLSNDQKKAVYTEVQGVVDTQNANINALVEGAKKAHTNYSAGVRDAGNKLVTPSVVMDVASANDYLNKALNGYSKKAADHGKGETAVLDDLLEWKDANGTRTYYGINKTDANVIGFFAADKKAIEDAIGAPAATLAKANEQLAKDYKAADKDYDKKKTATSTHFTAVQGITFDLDAIKADVETLVQKANAKNATYGFEAPFDLRVDLQKQANEELTALTTLQGEVQTLINKGEAELGKAYNDSGSGASLKKGLKSRMTEVNEAIAAAKTSVEEITDGTQYAPATDVQKDDQAAKKAAAEDNKKANADLADDLNSMKKSVETLKGIKADAEKALKAVKAVNDSNDKYQTAREKVFGVDKTYDQAKATVHTKYPYAEAPEKVGGKTDTRYTDAVKKIDKALETLDKKVADAKTKETLNDATWESDLATITTQVNSLVETGKAVAENHEASLDMQEAVQKVTDAIDALPAYDDPDGKYPEGYYTKLVAGYKDKITKKNTGYNDQITNYEKNKNAVDNKERVIKELDELLTKVKAVPTDAAANKKAYDEQKKGLTEVQKHYNDVYSEINATDQSSKLAEYNQRLSAIQNDITALDKKVDGYYNEGQANAKNTDVVKAIAELMNAINGISAEQSGGYDQQIADDNAARYNDFNTALKATEAEFTKAVDMVDAFANVTNANLKAAYDNYNATATDNIHDYPTRIKELAANAAKKYAETKSPALYDPESNFTKRAEKFGEEIKNAAKAFKDGIYATITGNRYDADRNDGWNAAMGILNYTKANDPDPKKEQTRTNLVNSKFEEIDAAIKTYKDARNAMNVPVMDEQMNLLDNGLDKMVTAAKHETAAADLQTGVDARREKVDEELSYLATLTGQENLIKGYKDAVKNYLEQAEKSLADNKAKGKCFDNYVVTKGYLDQFDADQSVKDTKALCDNASKLEAVQKQLEDAAATISAYHLSNEKSQDYAKKLNKVQEILDNIAKTGGKAGDAKTAANNINGYLAQAKKDAVTYLETEAKTALQTQYNKLISEKYADLAENELPDDVQDLKKRIDAPYINDADDKKDGEVVKLRNQLNTDASKLKPEQILAADKNLSETYDATQKMRGADEAENAAALDKLNEGVKALEDKLAIFDENSDEVKAQLADEKASIEDKIAKTKADIEAHKDKAAFYADDIQALITALDTPIDNLIKEAAVTQTKIDDNNAAYERIGAQIADLQTKLDEAYEEVSGYEAAKERGTREFDTDGDDETDLYQTYEFRIKKEKEAIQKRIDSLQKLVDRRNQAVSLKKDTNYDGTINSISQDIDALLDDCAYQEAYWQATILEENMWEARWSAESKATLTEAAKAQISKKLAEIQTAIGTWDNFEEETDNGTVIVQDWTEGSLKRLIDDSDWVCYDEKENLWRDESYETLPEIMEMVEAIQAEIDDVKELIGDDMKKGDVNNDGKVNVNDYVTIIDHVLAGDLVEGSDEFKACDLNNDGKVNVADATCVINLILHGNINGWAAAHAREDFEGGSNDVNVTTESLGNGVTRLAINLANTKSYVAAQMDIVLPSGVTIVNETLGDRASGHSITSKDINGVHRILMSNVTNEKFDGNDGAVLYIDVETTSAYINGGVSFDNVIFADVNGRANVFSIENGSTTAINGIATEKSVSDKIYDFGGRMMNALKQGFNIVGGKKVYVK